jgi:integrase
VTALGQCKALPVNPARGIGGKARKTKPLLWTEPRVERWKQTGKRPGAGHGYGARCSAARSSTRSRLTGCTRCITWPPTGGLRRSELSLEWADLDLKSRRLHVRQAQAADELDSTKSEDSDRIIVFDEQTANVLEAWRERQLFERLEWGDGRQDSGRVFTREDGSPLRPGHISEHMQVLSAGPACRRSGSMI